MGECNLAMNETVRRLSRLNDLKREVDDLSQRIAQLEQGAAGGVGRISGLPRSGRVGDRVARLAAVAADLRERMELRRLDCMEELGRIYDRIDGIDDSRLRLIFTLRYIDGLTWQQIAFAIDEADEQTPRRLHNRFLRETPLFLEKLDENDEGNVL